MARKKRSIKAPYIITVGSITLGAAALGGCDGGSDLFADDDDGCDTSCCGDATCNPPPPPPVCPAEAPQADDPCEFSGDVCDYTAPDACGGMAGVVATCQAGLWTLEDMPGECEPSCPIAMPEQGQACDASTSSEPCAYDDGCAYHEASCDDGAWNITWGICNPPPPVESCDELSEDACGNTLECQWVVPGCGAEIGFEPGCHPVEPCTNEPDTCDAGTTCAPVVYDPCYGSECNACAAETRICLPTGL